LFLEHVHMNFHGNYLFGKTVFQRIAEEVSQTLGPTSRNLGSILAEEECAERLAHTDWSKLKFAAKTSHQLLQGPPFTFQIDHAERCAQWKRLLAATGARLEAGGIQEAIAECQRAVQKSPADWMIRNTLGQLLMDCGRLPEASEQFQQ